MSCNGCRVLRRGCSEACELRSCLQWIESPEAQGHATMFVAKFFGRAGLKAFISNVHESQRAGLFESLLFEACGRTINPVSGAVGLLGSGNWSLCQAAVDTVLRGGTLPILSDIGDCWSAGCSSFSAVKRQKALQGVEAASDLDLSLSLQSVGGLRGEAKVMRSLEGTSSMSSEYANSDGSREF